MRDLFPGYYRPTQAVFDELWKTAIFVLDANILLLPYRSTPATWKRFSEVLERFSDRIWVPHQAAYEYHKNRVNVIFSQKTIYAEVQKDLDTIQSAVNRFQNSPQHHFIDYDVLAKPLDAALKKAQKALGKMEAAHLDFTDDDPFRDFFDKILSGHLGIAYSVEELGEKRKQAEARYRLKLPPGYADAEDKKKSGEDPYGDAIMWMQLIDYAKKEHKPIIFVTEEKKEDWWRHVNKQRISPRPELVEELRQEADVDFYMYRIAQFVDYAGDYLDLAHQPEVIAELEDIGWASQSSIELDIAEAMISEPEDIVNQMVTRQALVLDLRAQERRRQLLNGSEGTESRARQLLAATRTESQRLAEQFLEERRRLEEAPYGPRRAAEQILEERRRFEEKLLEERRRLEEAPYGPRRAAEQFLEERRRLEEKLLEERRRAEQFLEERRRLEEKLRGSTESVKKKRRTKSEDTAAE